MPYKVHKLIDDKRNTTCGFFIPNGGFYWVLEMTFENHKQLTDLSQRAGYTVDFVSGPEGFFDRRGLQVDPDSVTVDKITKQVVSYEHVTRKYKGVDKPIAGKHIDVERQEVLERAQRQGKRVSGLASTLLVKRALGKEVQQSSLSSNTPA